VAKKLQRKYVGVEIDETYCCIAEKRLEMADHDTRIQGYEDGVFWDRNSLGFQKRNKRPLAVQRRLLA
ncbi:MAG: site-specific DNA-methyltransferase, partial [Chloroflexi bacterium]|nr:site-specific DNA-methyltransferase [Chloroflexota bacterium]